MKLQPVVVLLCLTTVTLDCKAGAPEPDPPPVKDFSDQLLHVVPSNSNHSYVIELVLDGNQILLNESDRQALGTYPALMELHLERNLVTRVPAGFFSVVPSLTTLSLAKNKIHSLDSKAFSGLDLLTHLDLSENQLESLSAEIHKGLHSLQMLQLQGNPWNCSCLLLGSITELTAANISIGAAVTCASPPDQAGSEVLKAAAECSSPPPDNGTGPLTPTTPGNSKQPLTTTTAMNQSGSQNHNKTDGQKAALGNSWKFTASVAALAVVTSGLIVCAVKGPSWYKLFYNYRHRRLHQDDDGNEDNFAATVFKKKGSYRTPRAFTFQNEDGRPQEEEPEDEYFEDPYIKSNENGGEENPTEL